MKKGKMLYNLILIVFLSLDYAFKDIYYSFAFLGYMIMYYFENKSTEKYSLPRLICDFIILPIVVKIVIIYMLRLIEFVF